MSEDRIKFLEDALAKATMNREQDRERDQARIQNLEMAREQDRARIEQDRARIEQDRARIENLEMARDEARARIQNLEKARGREEAKNVLISSSFRFVRLSDLLSLIDRCELDLVPIAYLTDYLRKKRDTDTSLAYLNDDKSSVTASECAENVMDLTAMRRRMNIGTSSKFTVKKLNLSNFEEELCHALFNDNRISFDNFIERQRAYLGSLRKALYYMMSIKKGISEVQELQPYATLLLEAFVKELYSSAVVVPGQRILLEGTLMIGTDADTEQCKTIKGYTDLIIHESNSEDDDASKAICIIELKSPQGKLYHSGAAASKDQLLFEMEVVGQMGCKPLMVLGGLTDLFAITVMVRKVVGDVCTFYIADRVTGLDEFIKYLLLLLCRDHDSVWKLLLKHSTADYVDEEEDEEVEDKEEEEEEEEEGQRDDDDRGLNNGDDTSTGDKENISSGTTISLPWEHLTSQLSAKEAAVALRKLQTMDRIEEYNEAVSRLLSWDNKRNGLGTLTSATLNKLNATPSRE